jgi:HAD superfamily hydrolase (TIGR01484 family)
LGKPFDKEIEDIQISLTWAFAEPIHPSFQEMVSTFSSYPLFIVGSGGSLSGAHFIARLHELTTGQMARAITPLDLLFSQANPALHAVLFLTASGNNKDILSAFDYAIHREFISIGIICANPTSRIVQKSKLYPHSYVYGYSNPAGKDGFLAVNSLLSTCILAARAYDAIDTSENVIRELINNKIRLHKIDLNKVLDRKTIIALGGEWAWPALIDLESKFTEAALGNVLLTDFRNFAHGRHYWFDKKGDESAVLVLETPPLYKLAKKTMDLLPKKYPRAVLSSFLHGPLAGIDLYLQIFGVVNEAGKRACIDPGRPKVSEFGRKIYHIGLSPTISKKITKNRDIWVHRKALVSNQSPQIIEEFLDQFIKVIKETLFDGIVLDYDGTLCDKHERFRQPNLEIATVLNHMLTQDITIGVATGRGRSVQKSLRKVINKDYWDSVVIGNYNGSVVLPLTNNLPDFKGTSSKALIQAYENLNRDFLLVERANFEFRSKQISITPKARSITQTIFKRILELLSQIEDIKITQSGHSIDVLDTDVSKKQVVEVLRKRINDEKSNILIIGDQGQYGGNDFELLNLPHSLSVDQISSSTITCWNLSPIGLRGSKATLSILRSLEVEHKTFRLNVGLLEEER